MFESPSIPTPKEVAEKALGIGPTSSQQVAAAIRGVEAVQTPTPKQIADYLAQQAALAGIEKNNE